MSEGQYDMTTGEVVEGQPVDDGTVEVYREGQRRKGDVGLAEFMSAPEGSDDWAPEELAYRAIIEQIINAPTVRDVLTPIEAVNAGDELDHPFELHKVDYRESDFEQGATMYAALQVRWIDTKEQGVITTGNQAVMAQLISLQTKHDAAYKAFQEWEAAGSKGKQPQPVLPIGVKLVEVGKPNQYGNRPLRLATPDWTPRKDRTQAARNG
jgi:hypothetical protein